MSRRLRIYTVRECDIIDLLNATRCNAPTLLWRLPKLANVPADAKIAGVTTSWEKRCLEVMVEHESFAEVPDGAPIPSEHMADVEWVTGRLVVGDEQADEPAVVGAT